MCLKRSWGHSQRSLCPVRTCVKRSWSHFLTSPKIIVQLACASRDHEVTFSLAQRSLYPFVIRLGLRERSGTEGSRWLFLFFVDAVLLCFACVATLCALELVHQSDVFYGSVLQVYCVVQFNLRRSQWNGCAKASRRVLVLRCCVLRFCLCFAGHCWQIALGLLHHGCDLNVRNVHETLRFFG